MKIIMGYSYGRLGATGNARRAQKKRSKKRVTKTKIVSKSTPKQVNIVENKTVPREIKVTIPEGRIWKGVPGGAAEAAWRKSFEPGYKPQVISPRDSSGGYDPTGTQFTVLTEKDQAREIAVSLGREGKPIPSGIVETLKQKLGIISNDVKKTQAPTAVTISKPSAKSVITGRQLINKYTDGLKADVNVVGVIVVVVLALALYIWKK